MNDPLTQLLEAYYIQAQLCAQECDCDRCEIPGLFKFIREQQKANEKWFGKYAKRKGDPA